MIAVTGLFVYPLKGGRGLTREQLAVGRFGPEDDRRWMVVDEAGALVTQREIPRLCQVGAEPGADRLTLTAPGRPPLVIPGRAAGARRPVRVWDDYVGAADQGDEAAAWLSGWLGASVRLVWMPDDGERRTDPDYDPEGSPVSFADGYPLLLASESSLADLNGRLAVPLPMNRFRPNVVITGAGPFAEDRWRRITIGGRPFDLVKPCARCPVTTTDQDSGARGVEPLRTLATFRKRNGGVMFGINMVHRGPGPLGLGDPVEVVRTA